MKRTKFMQRTATLLAMSMLAGTLASCGSTAPTQGSAANDTAVDASGQTVNLADMADNMALTDLQAEPITLPIKDGLELSFFSMPESIITSKMTGYADMTVHQVAEEQTGIKINWREESYTDPATKMNLMFSTGETEDIIWDAYVHATGGAKKLLDDEMIVPLNKYIEYYAPNLKQLLLDTPGLQEQISTDDGTIYCFPEIRLDPITRSNSGMAIRQDWLDEAGLPLPVTIEDWYNTLTTFQDLDMNGNGLRDECFVSMGRSKTSQNFLNFSVAWGFIDGWYMDGDTVKYAPLEPEYLDYLTEMAKWYSEGLIDPEFSTQDSNQFSTKMTNDVGAAYYGNLAGNLGTFMLARGNDGSGYELTGVLLPPAEDGTHYVSVNAYSKMVPHGASIATTCEDIISAVKYLDWHYSPEGHELYNWGVEGEAFEVVDGKNQFTDLVLNNPDGLSIEEAGARYAGGVITQMPVVNDTEVFTAMKSQPQQQAAVQLWSTADQSLILPTLFFDTDRLTANANIMSDIDTYVGEMFNKYIMGIESLDSFEDFQATILSMNVQEVLDSYQTAYDTHYMK